MASAILQVRVDPTLRDSATQTFEEIGLDLPTAIRIFLKKAVAVHGIPFDVRSEFPNEATLAAMANIEHGIGLSRSFHSVSELMEDLNADDQV